MRLVLRVRHHPVDFGEPAPWDLPAPEITAVEGEITGDFTQLARWFSAGVPEFLDLSKISPRLRGKGVLTDVSMLPGYPGLGHGSLAVCGKLYVDGELLERAKVLEL